MIARRGSIAFAALAVGLGLAACTSEVGGQANPSTSVSTTNSATADPSNPFAGLSACTVLDQALAGQGLPQAVPGVADPNNTCKINRPTSGTTPGLVVGLILQAGASYRDNVNNPAQASEGTVNGRPAIEEQEPLHVKGQCAVRFQVRDSRALMSISFGSDTAGACQQAKDIAPKVEPLLPKNN
ncbi:DUF3558 family protein [Amycolatopsis sp. RTGN1]|uniref:DUF3558 family protein n=1 Tax=Amycolatopsis ponsaeliensis TaxID=2992142 RepID=UPI00254BFA1D|nr:DUF3558 family protein [Amycolatopsis sp. RTGN1]